MDKHKKIEKIYQLSPMQEGMLFHSLLNVDKEAYFEQISFNVKGFIDIDLFEKSINTLIERHEILRTIFVFNNIKRARQVVVRRDIKVFFHDVSMVEDKLKEESIGKFKKEDKSLSFDLSKDIPIRANLFRMKEDEYIFIFSFHHIILDGWSLPIIFKELFDIYSSLKENIPLKQEKITQYSSYIKWLEKKDKKQALLYWESYLKDYEQQAQVPRIIKASEETDYINSDIKFIVDRGQTKKLIEIARKNKVTLNVIFQTIWGTLLQRYNNIDDVAFGTVVSGRPPEIEGIENMVGLFINTVPVRIKGGEDKSFVSLSQEVQRANIESKKYEYIQLAEIQANTNLKQQLIDNIVVFENYPEIKYGNKSDLKIEVEEVFEQTNYNFNIVIGMTDEILIKLNYNESVYDKQHVDMVAGHIQQLIREVIENPEVKISQIEILSEEEKKKILVDFNDTKAEYPRNKTFQQLFEEQVKSRPDNVALVFEDKQLTYRELNRKANKLARTLRMKGVKQDSIVGIMVERSLEMIIGIIAIIKSGGAYLPIDPEYPKERVDYMLKDSKINLIITQHHLINNFEIDCEKIDINDSKYYCSDDSNLECVNTPNNLIYIIYTSGTTGNPKGVMIEQGSLTNLVFKWRKHYNLDKFEVRLLQMVSMSFDVFTVDLCRSLLNGGVLYICSNSSKIDITELYELLIKNKINIFDCTPSLMSMFMDYVDKNNLEVNYLKLLVLGADTCPMNEYRKLIERYGKRMRVINSYGVTEATIDSSFYEEQIQNIPNIVNTPIGRPIHNTKFYILSNSLRLQPIGVIGELYIGGEGVARGYYNNFNLTKEKFIVNPFKLDERLYKTGDLARWLPDGNVEFLGRIDNQIKIRGFRIEIGEIENQLLNYKSVKNAIIIDKENGRGNKYLCAYIVAGEKITASELREYLLKRLPQYMVPSYFEQMESIPLTPNGKVDRSALPEPNKYINTGVNYIAPRNGIEEKIAKVWSEVLGLEQIGIDDDFFALGGDSIKAIQVSARLSNYLLNITVKDLFSNSTIRQLGGHIIINDNEIRQASICGEVELTAIQKWFFEQKFKNMHHWNQAFMLYSKEGFDERIISKVFSKIVEHHDALRMVVRKEEDKIMQYNRGIEDKLFDLLVMDFRNKESYEEEIEQEANKMQSSINLTYGPLVKLGLFKTNDGDHLLIVIHHLVVDGVSWRILLEDFTLAYKQVVNKKEIELPAKTHSFKEWAEKIKAYAKSSMLLQQAQYWANTENEELKEIPTKVGSSTKNNYDFNNMQINLSKEYTEKLLRNTNQTYNTEINDILLAALGLAITELTGGDKALVNLEGHGREDIISNINVTRTIGWFTSEYPIILDCKKSKDMGYYIKSIKEGLRKIPNKGIGYNILKYITPKEYISDLEFKLNPQISFNYLGQFDNDVNQEKFKISPISTGESVSKESKNIYIININGMILNKELILEFEYSNDMYDKNIILEFINNYKIVLLNIINHCVEKEEVELTPSDFDDEMLSIEELQDIKSTMNTLFS